MGERMKMGERDWESGIKEKGGRYLERERG